MLETLIPEWVDTQAKPIEGLDLLGLRLQFKLSVVHCLTASRHKSGAQKPAAVHGEVYEPQHNVVR